MKLAWRHSCPHCEEPIREGEPSREIRHAVTADQIELRRMHEECFVRLLVGGVNHQRGTCRCCGGDQPPDPPSLSKREAAILAARRARDAA